MKGKLGIIFNIMAFVTFPGCCVPLSCVGINSYGTGPMYLSNPVRDNNGNIHLGYIFEDTRGFYPLSFSHITFEGNNTYSVETIDTRDSSNPHAHIFPSLDRDFRDVQEVMFSINDSIMSAGLWYYEYKKEVYNKEAPLGYSYYYIHHLLIYENLGEEWEYAGEITLPSCSAYCYRVDEPSCEITSAALIPSPSTNYLFYTKRCNYAITATVLDLLQKNNNGFKKVKEWSWNGCTFTLTSRILESKNFYALMCRQAIISYNYNEDRWDVMEMEKFPAIWIRTYQKNEFPYIVSASIFEDFEGNPALLDSSGYYQESYSSSVKSTDNAVIYHFTSSSTWYMEETPIPSGEDTIIFDTYVQDNILYMVVYIPSKGYEYFTYDGTSWGGNKIPYNELYENTIFLAFVEKIRESSSSVSDEFFIPRTIVDKYGNFHVFMFQEYFPDHYKKVDEGCGKYYYTFVRGFHEWYDGYGWQEEYFGEVEE